MKIRKLNFALMMLCFLLGTSVNAQSYIDKAEVQFDLHAYDLALDNYKKAYEEDKTCNDCMFKIGECYRNMNNNIDAFNWFARIPKDYDMPAYHFAFGTVLKKLGRFEEASDQFKLYARYNNEDGMHYAEGCSYAEQIISNTEVRHVDHLDVNSNSDDFSAAVFDGNLIFSSYRTDIDKSASKDYSLLYKSDQFGVSLLQDVFLGDINVASLSLDEEESTSAYHKHHYMDGYSQIQNDDKSGSIHFAKLDSRANFLKETPFSYNSVEYSNAFPYLAKDNSYMIFSSNMPGGIGGFDLYISYRTEIGWTEPLNLGTLVNTPGNEISPMVEAEQLFFSSDYHHGLGGYDIFSSEFRDGYYTYPKNMGKGINSPEDDMYPYYDLKTDLFYFSSNRMGGHGNLDIYAASGETEIDYLSMNTETMPKPEAFELSFTNKEAKFQTVSLKEDPTTADVILPELNIVDPIETIEVPNAVHLNAVDETPVASFVSLEEEMIAEYELAEEFDGALLKSVINLNQNPKTGGDQVYFIQLGAFYTNNADVSNYTKMSSIGNIYKMSESGATKIRLGYFYNRTDAESKLATVKNAGFNDAFITKSSLNQSSLQLLASANQEFDADYAPAGVNVVETSPTHEYKVRLASYTDPNWFDINSVKDIGTIEQWSKQNWTIFVLSGYESKEAAKRAMHLAQGKGFSDAYVVLDDKGILKKVDY